MATRVGPYILMSLTSQKILDENDQSSSLCSCNMIYHKCKKLGRDYCTLRQLVSEKQNNNVNIRLLSDSLTLYFVLLSLEE